MSDNPTHPYNQCQVVTIDVLPDDVLLEIFDFHVIECHDLVLLTSGGYDTKRKLESWQSLVHVCRRWRCLVFGSRRRLNLRLCCTAVTSARISSDIWPALPLHIRGSVSGSTVDNLLAEVKHGDRICEIKMDLNWYTTSEIETLLKAMQVPFPELGVLYLQVAGLSSIPVLPDLFLGGSAPRLRHLTLISIPFPGISKLLLSATHLVYLWLINIPHSGYISPKAMVTCLTELTSLKLLQLEFESPESSPGLDTQRPFPLTPVVLPTLTRFWFKGANEYLEDFLARIDAPKIELLSMTLFNDIDFDTPELIEFISRTQTLRAYHEARLIFHGRGALIGLRHERSDHRTVEVNILCEVSNWQLSSMAQICTLSLPLLLTMENLYIDDIFLRLDWKGDIEDTEWLDLLQPFTTVKNLYLSEQFAPRIAPTLKKLSGGQTTDLLPELQNVFLQGYQASVPVHEGIALFISARKPTDHPVAISVWNRDLAQDESEESEVDNQ